MTKSKHVLVPVDESPPARKAFEFALANYDDAKITLLHVVSPITTLYVSDPGVWDGSLIDQQQQAAERLLAELRGEAEERGVEVDTEIEFGEPQRQIIECAEAKDADHVVMGSHGRSGVSRVLLGSVAETVARRSPTPVTIVR